MKKISYKAAYNELRPVLIMALRRLGSKVTFSEEEWLAVEPDAKILVGKEDEHGTYVQVLLPGEHATRMRPWRNNTALEAKP